MPKYELSDDKISQFERSIEEILLKLESIGPSHPEDKYKLEQEFIVRYLIQQGYTVDEDALFETIVSIITHVKEDKVINDTWRSG